MIPELRIVKNDQPGVVLPDWRTISYLDDCFDVGALQFEYPMRTGINQDQLTDKAEIALFVDGKEIPNGRFLYDERSGNHVTDTPGYLTYACPSYLSVLEEVVVLPRKQAEATRDRESDDEAAARQQQEEETTDEQERAARRASGDDADSEGVSVDDPDSLGRTPSATASAQEDTAQTDTKAPPKGPLFHDVTPGEMLLALLRAGKTRGAIPDLRHDFTADKDSDGMAWNVTFSHRPDVGQSLLEIVQWLHEEKKAEVRCEGRTLRAFNSGRGSERASVLLARGKNMLDGPRTRSARDLVTAVYVVSDAGPHGWVVDKALQKQYKRREGFLSLQGVTKWADCADRGRAFLKAQGKIREQIVIGLAPDAGVQPYRDFDMADWVYMDDDGTPEKMRVRAVTLDWDENGSCSAGVTLNDRLYEQSVTSARKIKRFQAHAVGIGAATTEPDGRAPVRPSAPVLTSRSGTVAATWDGLDEEGSNPIWDQAFVEVHVGPTDDFAPDTTTLVATATRQGPISLPGMTYDLTQYARLVAVDTGGDRSEPSDATSFQALQVTGDDIAPSTIDPTHLSFTAGGITTYVQPTAPVTANTGDLWLDSDDGYRMYRWNGSQWVDVRDTGIAGAQATADGKNKVTYSASSPGAAANTAGDIWYRFSGAVVSEMWKGNGGTSWTQMTLTTTTLSSLDAGVITSGLVSTERLMVGSGTNWLTNPGFETGAIAPHTHTDTGTASAISATAHGGGSAALVTLGTRGNGSPGICLVGNGPRPTNAATVVRHLPVKAGDSLRGEAWVRYVSGTAINCRVMIEIFDAAGTSLTQLAGTPIVLSTTYTQVSVDISAVPQTNAAYATLNVQVDNCAAGNQILVDDLLLSRKVTGVTIADGTITSNILASNAVVAGKIAAGAVTASTLAVTMGGWNMVADAGFEALTTGSKPIMAAGWINNGPFYSWTGTAHASTSTANVGPRTNLVTNPSFETNLTSWTAGGSVPPTLSQSAVRAVAGSSSMLLTWGTGGTFPQVSYQVAGLTIGSQYTASAYVYVPAGHPNVQLFLGGTGGTVVSTKDAWVRTSVVRTAAATTEGLQLIAVQAPTAGQQCWVDAVLVEAQSSVQMYFDGDTVDALVAKVTDQKWQGTQSLKWDPIYVENYGYFPMQGGTSDNVALPLHVAGETYTASVYVRVSTQQDLCLMNYGDSGTSGPTVTVPANTWTRLTCTFVAGTNVYLSVRVPGRGSAVVSPLWMDGFQIERGDVMTAWAPSVGEILPGTIVADMVSGKRLEGVTVATGPLGQTRLELTDDTYAAFLKFYSTGDDVHYGSISGNGGRVTIDAPASGTGIQGTEIDLYGDHGGGSDAHITMITTKMVIDASTGVFFGSDTIGTPLRRLGFNVQSVTSDGSGIITINHGLSATPLYAAVIHYGGSAHLIFKCTSRDNAQIKFEVWNSVSNALHTSTTISVGWLAMF